jgi:hypothetical protein
MASSSVSHLPSTSVVAVGRGATAVSPLSAYGFLAALVLAAEEMGEREIHNGGTVDASLGRLDSASGRLQHFLFRYALRVPQSNTTTLRRLARCGSTQTLLDFVAPALQQLFTAHSAGGAMLLDDWRAAVIVADPVLAAEAGAGLPGQQRPTSGDGPVASVPSGVHMRALSSDGVAGSGATGGSQPGQEVLPGWVDRVFYAFAAPARSGGAALLDEAAFRRAIVGLAMGRISDPSLSDATRVRIFVLQELLPRLKTLFPSLAPLLQVR